MPAFGLAYLFGEDQLFTIYDCSCKQTWFEGCNCIQNLDFRHLASYLYSPKNAIIIKSKPIQVWKNNQTNHLPDFQERDKVDAK